MSARALVKAGLFTRVALGAAVVSASILAARPASAALVIPPTVTRTVAKHTPDTFTYYISRTDCEDGKDEFQFAYTVAGTAVTGLQLEVWLSDDVSLDCSLAANRAAAATLRCTQLTSVDMPKTTGGTVSIKSRDIARAVTSVTPNTCEDTNSDTNPRALNIYFLLKNSSGGNIDTDHTAVFSLAYLDMLGPAPPADVTANPLENALNLTFTVSTTADVAGYYVYCDPPPEAGTGGAGGSGGSAATPTCTDVPTTSTTSSSTSTTASSSTASSTASATSGAGGSGGVGGGTTTSSVAATTDASSTASGGSTKCTPTSDVLKPGEIPPCAYICGTAGNSSSATASNLVNKTQYAVGVAAFDKIGNIGPLSSLACGSPEEVDDFFDKYRNAGGTGGGCGCSVVGNGDVLGAGLFVGGLAYMTALRRRRRRTR